MRRQILIVVLAVASLTAGACTTFQDPPNAPARLSLVERAGSDGVIHSDVIAAAGPLTTAHDPVSAGEMLASFAFRYRHTAVLTEDVVGHSITVGGVQAPAGSPGYYAGTFIGGRLHAPGAYSELWCFLPGVVGGKRKHLCFLRDQPGIAAIAPTRMNPWLWTQFAPATGTFDYVRTPIYDRRTVDIPGDLKLEYRFRGWSTDAARLTEYAVGREVRDFDVPRLADGIAVLRTVAGDIVMAPAPDAPSKALVSLR